MKKILSLLTVAVASLSFMSFTAFSQTENPDKISHETFVFKQTSTDTLKLDIYTKATYNDEAGKRPVFIYVHGGGFSAGSRKNAAQQVMVEQFVKEGFVGVQIDYRLGAAEGGPAKYNVKTTNEIIRLATEDLVSATNYILSKADELNLDTSKFIISGGSAGAFTCLQVEYDICNGEAYTKALPEGFNYAGIISQSGAIMAEKDSELVWEKNPCPILLMHGTEDKLVLLDKGDSNGDPFCGSKYIHEQLTKMNVPHWYYIFEGYDHVVAMRPLTDDPEAYTEFYRKYVVEGRQRIEETVIHDQKPYDMSDVMKMVEAAPLYILGYDQYLEDIDWSNLTAPTEVKY